MKIRLIKRSGELIKEAEISDQEPRPDLIVKGGQYFVWYTTVGGSRPIVVYREASAASVFLDEPVAA